VLLETRGSVEVTSSPPKPLAEEPPSTADADAHEAEDMVNSMLRDSPTLDAEEGGEKRVEEISIGKLLCLSPQISECALLVFSHPRFFSRSSKSVGFCGEVEETPRADATLVVGLVLPLLHRELPHHKQRS
jgi:hypothetical protein